MKLLFTCLMAFVLFSFFPIPESQTFRQLKQLEGTWKMQTSRRTIYEKWNVTGEQQMAGKSFMLRGTDTVILEQIKLEENKDGIFYIPAVRDQNQGKPVAFKLISTDELKFVFENKEHDFPQRIIYHLAAKDSVHAWIEGTRNGKEGRSDFYYKRER